MIYRKFGKTGEMLSNLGFGCMRFPIIDKDDMSSIDEEKSIEMVRYAIDNGLNYLDTAYNYHASKVGKSGESELLVGKIIKDGYRDKVKIATKLPSWLIETREDMDKYLNEQLERLEIETIDFYLLHTLNKKVWDKLKKLGVREFLNSAIEDGRIKYAGFSYHDKPENFKEIIDAYDFSFCQIQFNYLDEDYQAGLDGLNYASEKDLGIVIMEPLRGGKLVENLPREVEDIFNRSQFNRTPAEWALRWLWNNEKISIVLSGMSNMDQVMENINIAKDARENSFTEKEENTIEEVKKIFRSKIQVDCTACAYCMPCPHGVNIPKNFEAYNNYYLFKELDSYKRLKDEEKSLNCIKCKICEEHCPQHINISEELERVNELFEAQS